MRLNQITRLHIQDLADRLRASGLSPSTVRNTMMPLRAIFRRLVARGELAINPTQGLELPAVRGRRDRIADPAEAEQLLEVLSEFDRPIWATAMYAGLRLGELRALQWEDVDFEAGVIHVRRSWDPKEGFVEPKSRAGERRVPLTDRLKQELVLLSVNGGALFVFPGRTEGPFSTSELNRRAKTTWRQHKRTPITLHECRHTFASMMIAAGVNAKALSTYLGHSSISITLDRYGHLMPGNEQEAANLLDVFLTKGRPQS